MSPPTATVKLEEKVHWHEWSGEAFELARREDKLLLLDIGAVWCHWCHVMDRTTYGDRQVADFINEHFIPLRVDRDQRPDIDRRYQGAPTLIQSRGGGWPLTVFLLPNGQALYRATYLPPEDREGMVGFITLAEQVLKIYRDRRTEIDEAANRLDEHLAAASLPDFKGTVTNDILDTAFAMSDRLFDETWGGFAGDQGGPKFPSAGTYEFLMAYAHRTGKKRATDIVTTTLGKMAEGGLHDTLAGGFHRYSIDRYWRVPHFEKMLYDNAELLVAYLHAWQATGSDQFRRTAEDILRFSDEVLSDRERGGFFGSQDADVGLHDDGDYFTWSLEEAGAILSEKELEVFAMTYDVGQVGEMTHDRSRNVLWRAMSAERVAGRLDMKVGQVRKLLASARSKALAARLKRPRPLVDKTLYVNWNGMMIRAYVLASQVLDRGEALAMAGRSADRLLQEALTGQGSFVHVVGRSAPSGLLSDQAWMTLGLIELYQATGHRRYLATAQRTAEWADRNLWDADSGGYFDRPADPSATALAAVRNKPIDDSPSSSANAIMALALMKLGAVTGQQEYDERARRLLESLAGVIGRLGVHGGALAHAAEIQTSGVTRVVIIGPPERTAPLARAAHDVYTPGKVVMVLDPNQADDARQIKALGYNPKARAAAYVCRGTQCLTAVTTAENLRQVLAGT